VCTLFDGDYHYGLAALINSLVRNGFRGTIVAGHRGAVPPWINQLNALGCNNYEVSPGVGIEFIRLDTPIHLTNLKPEFMKRVIGERNHSGYIWYFDPDIVIRCPWAFYLRWVKHGICLCEDVNSFRPADHPVRLGWMELVRPLGWIPNGHRLSRYYNAGFIGLATEYSRFLDRWEDAQRIAVAEGYDPRGFGTGGFLNLFPAADQDALNIAAMYSEYPLTTVGAEGMGFSPGEGVMYHAIGPPKPWGKNMFVSALRGRPPSPSDKAYLENTAGPIRLYSRIGLARRRAACALGAALGRFYRRR
jgi:hypothetical protein